MARPTHYRSHAPKKLRGKEYADQLISWVHDLRGNAAATFFALADAPPSVQKRVLGVFKTPRGRGRPRKGITDQMCLEFVESYRKRYIEFEDPYANLSDLAVIEYGLKDTANAANPFDPNSEEGRAKVRRIRDAAVRARRALKSRKTGKKG